MLSCSLPNCRVLPPPCDTVIEIRSDAAQRGTGILKGLGGGRPVLVRSNELVLLLAVLVARRQLQVEVLEAERKGKLSKTKR